MDIYVFVWCLSKWVCLSVCLYFVIFCIFKCLKNMKKEAYSFKSHFSFVKSDLPWCSKLWIIDISNWTLSITVDLLYCFFHRSLYSHLEKMTDLVAVWEVALSDGVHKIEFEHGTTSGKRVVYVDGKVKLLCAQNPLWYRLYKCTSMQQASEQTKRLINASEVYSVD